MLTGASIVFFTYIGFDSISTAAEECRKPQRDLPFGIIATLIVCTLLYCSVALVLTGIANWKTLNTDSPVADALKALGYNRLRADRHCGRADGNDFVAAGLSIRAGANLVRDVARPAAAEAVFAWYTSASGRRTSAPGSPGFVVGIPAGIWDIDTFAELSNIGTLFAFMVVSAGVIVLRKKQPDRPRSFRCPWVPWLPAFSIVCCVVLMMGLPLLTWMRFFVWLIIGLVIYFAFSRKRSTLANGVKL